MRAVARSVTGTTRQVAFDPAMREPAQILGKFSGAYAKFPMKALTLMTANLGNSMRSTKPELRLNTTDDRFASFIETTAKQIRDGSNAEVASMATALNAFPPRTTDQAERVLLALTAAIAEEFLKRATTMTPDELCESLRALSFRRGLEKETASRIRDLAVSEIESKIDFLASYNCRMLLQSIAEWPIDRTSQNLGRKLTVRVSKLVANIHGEEAYKLLGCIMRGPNFVRYSKGSVLVQQELLNGVFKAWESYSTDAKVALMDIIARSPELVNKEVAPNINYKLSAMAGELKSWHLAGYIHAVALIKMRVDDFPKVLDRFVSERLNVASFRERVDVLWSLARRSELENAAFKTILESITGKPLGITDSEVNMQLLDVHSSMHGSALALPDSWIDSVKKSDKTRVRRTLDSQYGQSVRMLLENAKFSEGRLKLETDVQIGDYTVPFYDAEKRFAIDVAPRNADMPFNLRTRFFASRGETLLVIRDGQITGDDKQRQDDINTALDNAVRAKARERRSEDRRSNEGRRSNDRRDAPRWDAPRRDERV